MKHAILAACAALFISSCAAFSGSTITAGVSGQTDDGVNYHAGIEIPIKDFDAKRGGKVATNVQP